MFFAFRNIFPPLLFLFAPFLPSHKRFFRKILISTFGDRRIGFVCNIDFMEYYDDIDAFYLNKMALRRKLRYFIRHGCKDILDLTLIIYLNSFTYLRRRLFDIPGTYIKEIDVNSCLNVSFIKDCLIIRNVLY